MVTKTNKQKYVHSKIDPFPPLSGQIQCKKVIFVLFCSCKKYATHSTQHVWLQELWGPAL